MIDTPNTTTPEYKRQSWKDSRRVNRVLIADDEPLIRVAIRACLEAEGYEVEEAADGRVAITQIIQTVPDVVILDLAMPELDGLSVLRLLKQIVEEPRPRVIVLTAYGSISAASSAEEYGASAFLEKPLDPQVLRSVVSRVMGRDTD